MLHWIFNIISMIFNRSPFHGLLCPWSYANECEKNEALLWGSRKWRQNKCYDELEREASIVQNPWFLIEVKVGFQGHLFMSYLQELKILSNILYVKITEYQAEKQQSMKFRQNAQYNTRNGSWFEIQQKFWLLFLSFFFFLISDAAQQACHGPCGRRMGNLCRIFVETWSLPDAADLQSGWQNIPCPEQISNP